MTVGQASSLVRRLPPLARTLVALALLTGLRRGELFAHRWQDIDEERACLTVREAVYEGVFSSPKTQAGNRALPLSTDAINVLREWRQRQPATPPDALVFATASGRPLSPNNVMRQQVYPACEAAGLPRASWLTFRRTYSSWAHDRGVPAKVVAQLMGHAKVDTTLNVYTQVLDGAARAAAGRIGTGLFTIVH